ncbi:MAG TPA: glycosyltransferase [Baekduia sp.]|nr:glycosyltransferase [Baekduia sp.]
MTPFEPVAVAEAELAGDAGIVCAARPDGAPYATAHVLIRRHGIPVGFADVALDEGRAGARAVQAAARAQLGAQAVAADRRAELAPGPYGDPAAPATVVICTKDPGPLLARTLESVLAQDHAPVEVVVVDNASRTDAARRMAAATGDPRVRLVAEPVAGLCRARNRGLAAARTELVAFTDDDVRVDRGWLAALVRGFTRAPRVGCVTGLVPSAELDTAAQAFFDARVRWSDGFTPRLFDLREHRPDDPFFPYGAGLFGTGANFAVARRALAEVGTFDEALGMGTPAQNGDDLDLFLRVVLGGWTLAYEPSSVAWHAHRREVDALRRQMRTYGVGLGAYAFKHALRPRIALDMGRRLPAALVHLARDARAAQGTSTEVPGMAATELRGLVHGPAGYLRSRRLVRGRPAVSAT